MCCVAYISFFLGFAGEAADGLPYSTLSYANGPGFVHNEKGSKRQDLRKLNTGNLATIGYLIEYNRIIGIQVLVGNNIQI